MQEIPRAILLPPPAPLVPRSNARTISGERDAAVEATRGTQRQPRGAPQAFLTLIDSRPEDTIEIRGKQFRFRPYSGRGAAADGARESGPNRGEAIWSAPAAADDEIAVEVLEGFGAGSGERNSSAFIASLIAQERLREGLHNPRFAAASDAYRRAGGSPAAADNRPRLVSVAV